MSEVVLADVQWTMCRFVKPFEHFERAYQGKDGSLPIAFPGDLDLFARQGVQGYDPNLIAGISVPAGSRVMIWIPQTIAGYTINNNYQYQIIWRWRSVRDFNVGQAQGQTTPIQNYSSYHLATGSLGQPQVAGAQPNTANSRYFLPGASRTVGFEQAEPTGIGSGVIHLRPEVLVPLQNPSWVPPLTPSGADAVWQQGVYVNSSTANTGGPSWATFVCDADGDEMCILASKIDPTNAWDFTTQGALNPDGSSDGDLAFSNTYGDGNGHNEVSAFTSIMVTTGVGG